ncbi:hypothetical protein K491DRAFT_776840 [Lophiostoma macrostomum CBS 122681]|uniref:Uncharacterized protein n=1 Tax=Lophiostoma macrostomum CBS 122681 TaxID=1314788 RepID=A0A6A6TDM6_9PLEO|nr:hypothetical protein K491DRAFT_776840 [Lophiostoma macrostomum CBS 122681]
MATRRPVARPASSRGIRSTAYSRVGPRLRRGPEHSYSDAITQLGPIPILRPRQADHLSSDADEGDDDTSQEGLALGSGNPYDETTSLPQPQTSPQLQNQASPIRDLQLPYRPAARETSTSGLSDQQTGRSLATETQDMASTPSPPKRHSRLPNFGRATTNTSDDHSESASQALLDSAVDGFAEDISDVTPRASGRPGRSAAHLILQTSGGASSPLRQHTSSYLMSPGRYQFREHRVPHTEPRQRPNRSAHRTRTMSSNSDPAQLALAMGSERVRLLPTQGSWAYRHSQIAPEEHRASDDVQLSETGRPRSSFDERVRRAHRRIESMQGRYRGFFGRSRPDPPERGTTPFATGTGEHASHRVSETSSNASLPYSYYELPTSRHSSSDHSPCGDLLPHAQYDGASGQAARGAYYSIRPSQVRVAGPSENRLRRQRSSISSSNLAAMVSPLPASPYARGNEVQRTPRSATGLITVADILNGDHDQDASTAFARDLSSPLELLEQRAGSELARISRPLPSIERMRQHSGNTHQRLMPGGRHVEIQPSRPLNHRSLQPQRRAAPARAGQRSSENVPVIATQGTTRAAQLQGQRVSFGTNARIPHSQGANLRGGGTQSSPLPVRFSLPQPSSNQPRMRRSSRNLHRSDEQPSASSSPIRAYRRIMQRRASRSGRDNVRRDSPSQTASPGENFTYRDRLQPPPALFSVTYREPDRGAHVNHRRPPIPARVASRRVSAQQLNQENSGDAEAELMREEMAAAGMRFAENAAGLDIMDETPPRVGRFERLVMEN